MYVCSVQRFKILASFYSWADRFESYLVANPKNRFSRDGAQSMSMSVFPSCRWCHWKAKVYACDSSYCASLLLLSIHWEISVFHWKAYESSHEVMALFVLRKLILQTRMRSHPVLLDVWILVGPFVYFILHVCKQRRLWRDCADAQARLSLRWSPMW